MRSEQSRKISRYRRRLDLLKEQKIADRYSDITNTLSNVEIVAPDINIDMTGVEEAIKGISIKAPDIKVEPIIKVEAPVVNVVVPADVYARYKRVNSITDGDGTYHGFTDAESNWFVQRESILPNNQDVSRYAVGKGNFAQGWAGRKGLNYKPFNEVTIP